MKKKINLSQMSKYEISKNEMDNVYAQMMGICICPCRCLCYCVSYFDVDFKWSSGGESTGSGPGNGARGGGDIEQQLPVAQA